MKTLIVIPALNEAKRISAVIKDLKNHGYTKILVIDDGSEDKTGEIAAKNGAIVVRHVMNRGLGAGLGTGFEYAKKENYDLLVTFDGDGQHRAGDLKKLTMPILAGKTDVVIGSRAQDLAKMPAERKLANLIANLSTYFLYGIWTTDSQSGLRAFSKKAIQNIRTKTERMEVSSEFFKEIHRNKLSYSEIPIKAVYTDYSLLNSKQGNVMVSSVKIGYKMLLRLFR